MRITFKHNAPQIEAAILAKPAKAMTAIDGVLKRAAGRIVRDARLSAPKADSTLTNSLLSLRIKSSDYLVRAGVDYAGFVENETEPGGRAPIESLIDWITAKQITPNDPSMSLRDLAFVMQGSISAKGTKAQPFMRPAYEKVVAGLPRLLRDNVRRAVRR